METRLALAGNPNSGKTTMFNALTGSAQYVGNWPGVTVEKKEGSVKGHDAATVTDLPGIYSLSPYTPEEVVTRNFLLDEMPDAIINLVDATNIERNLYLTTQLTEIGIPVVIALNMMDIIEKNGDEIDIAEMSRSFGCEVVPVSAIRDDGLDELIERAIISAGATPKIRCCFDPYVENAIAVICNVIADRVSAEQQRWYAVKLFERDGNIFEKLKITASERFKINGIIEKCERKFDDDSESIITSQRYDFVEAAVHKFLHKKRTGLSTSDKIDLVATNRILALPVFALIMFFVYYISVTAIGNIGASFINDTVFGSLISEPMFAYLKSVNTAPWLIGLIIDGIIGGAGSVLSFVPQMIALFFMLCFLEDCGYMSRIAFIMDRIFRKFGLSGKSFIPLLIGSGCSVPGIMSSRTIEHEADRRMTIITTSFIPCGAKMPIVALIAGAFFGGAWWVAPLVYFFGIAAVIASGIMLKKTRQFFGGTAPFVMELPSYHLPTVKNVMRGTWERSRSFIKRAGTIIVLASIAVWFASNFGFYNNKFTMVDNMDYSILAYIGNILAFIFVPLGFGTWQSAVATFLGIFAKEQVVAVFGVLYNLGGNGQSAALPYITEHLNALTGFSFLLFNLLCAPCIAAISAIRREMNSGAWTLFAVSYQTAFAYGISLMLYQFGRLICGGGFNIGTIAAVLTLGLFVYMLVRKQPQMIKKSENFAIMR